MESSVIDKNEAKKLIILENLEDGLTFKDSCLMAGISEMTGHRWKALRQEDIDRLKLLQGSAILNEEQKKEVSKLLIEKELCEGFEGRVEASIIKYKKKLIKSTTLNSIKSGIVGLEVLRRRFPKEWNVPQKLEHSGELENRIIILPSNNRN